MPASKFQPQNTAVIVAQVKVGVTLSEASAQLGIRTKTVEGWLTRGRREKDGPYRAFLEEIEAARRKRQEAGLDHEEFDRALAKAVRSGSVQAMKLWWEIHGGDGDEPEEESDPFDRLDQEDELAKRRSKATA